MFVFTNQRAKVFVLLALVHLGLSCSRKSESVVVPVETLKRGDRVVVELTAADFFEGRVLEVQGAKLKLQRSDSGDILQVGKSDVYRLGDVLPRLNVNDYAVCEFTPHRWRSCRVLRVNPDGFFVADTEGQQLGLGPLQMLKPTGLSEMNIRRRFEDVTRRRTFVAAVSNAGQPRRVSGWSPAPQRLVVAERDGRWYGAKVTEVDDERVVLRWDGQKDLTDLPKAAVMPQPPACGTPLRGDRALRRPSGHGGPWEPVVVVGVDGPEVTVENIDRERIVVDLRELCPLGEPKATITSSPTPVSS